MRVAVSSFTFSAGIVARYNAVYVGGFTYSNDFPVVNAIQPITHGSADAFVTEPALVGIELWVIGTIYTALQDKDNALFWLERG